MAFAIIFLISMSKETAESWLFAILVLFALSGFFMAIFERLGIVKMVYTEKEKNGWMFGIQTYVAKQEMNLWGRAFSKKYYETYLDERS